MAIENKREHEIHIVNRENMRVSGVSDVTSFDENGVTLVSVDGELVIEGEAIKIGALDTERGVVTLSGRIDGFYYLNDDKDGRKEKKGFFYKLAR